MSNNLPSDAASLLVPVYVDAWSVSSGNQQSTVTYPSVAGGGGNLNYANLDDFQTPIQFPFTTGAAHSYAGIHLQWALPDALTHGEDSNGDGLVDFPAVPNRWMVARFLALSNQWTLQKVTVIQSDYVDAGGHNGDQTGGQTGTTPFLDPSTATTPGNVNQANIGRSWTISDWEARTDPDTGNGFLRAVGPGNATFSAFTPFMEDVFCYVDPADDLPGQGLFRYAYLIVGWFADADEDPLYGVTSVDDFNTRLAALQWSVDGTVPSPPPSSSLYHGLVFDVEWPYTSGNSVNPNIPDVDDISVVVGNTSVDCLAALIRAKTSGQANQSAGIELAQLLEAAQYDLLDDYGTPGGNTLINQQVRKAWFGSSAGGTVWDVVTSVPASAGIDANPPQLTPAQQTAIDQQLAALNQNQRAADTLARELASLQAELYRQWWKTGLSNTDDPYTSDGKYDPGTLWPLESTPQWAASSSRTANPNWNYGGGSGGGGGLKAYFLDTLYPALQQQVWSKYCDLQTALAALPDPNDANAAQQWADSHWTIPGAANLSALGLSLKAGAAAPFFHPNDPVLLFSGAGRSLKHGADGNGNADGTLSCRLPGQTITALQVSNTTVDQSALAKVNLNPLVSYTQVPSVPSLLLESFLADFNNAPVIAAATGLAEAQVSAAMTLPDDTWPNPNWTGTAPPEFALADWDQAWAPLFLEWTLTYYPTGSGDAQQHRFAIGDWSLGADAAGSEAYAWNGSGFQTAYATAYSGRTFITAQAPLLFKSKIEQYLQGHPALDSASLENLIDTVANWNIVSQSLSGLTDLLLTLKSDETFPPPSPDGQGAGGQVPGPSCPAQGSLPDIATLVGDQYHTMPICVNTNETGNQGTVNFYPVRGGMVVIQSLKLIDSFGQVLDVANANSPQGFLPLMAQGMTPNGSTDPKNLLPPGAFQLPPRVCQAGRLDFRLLSRDGSGQDILVADDPSAVCGWLLPNHLDGGVSVYDENGVLLGELVPDADAGTTLWRPRPGYDAQNPPPATPADIANQVLKSVVVSLSTQTSAVFADFLTVVDETLWTVDPLGGRKDQMLSALIGRPLAVVRASLALALDGLPVRNQIFDKMAVGSGTSQDRHGNNMAQPPWQSAQDSGEVLDVGFPVQLGNLELRNDGLLGYYAGSDYSAFNTLHYPSDISAGDSYIQQVGSGNRLTLKFDGSAQAVTMVLDPRGVVHACSGILPTINVNVPQYQLENFMSQLQVTFRAGPVIADPGALRIPRPAEQNATWSWLQRVGTGNDADAWQTDAIINATDAARLPDSTLQLRDGWLSMSLDDDSPEPPAP